MSNIFKLKLSALGHPNPESFNCEGKVTYMIVELCSACGIPNNIFFVIFTDEKEYRSVVLWLEDQKIRHYKIEDRAGLRNIDGESWKEAYNSYQKDLVSPASNGTPNEQLNWLLSYAVRLEYADNGKYEILTRSCTSFFFTQTCSPNHVHIYCGRLLWKSWVLFTLQLI